MNTEEWNQYVETGHVPMHFLKSMAESIKKGEALNTHHLAVYASHAEIIEVLLLNKSKNSRN